MQSQGLGCPRCVLLTSPLPHRAAWGPKQFAGGWGRGEGFRPVPAYARLTGRPSLGLQGWRTTELGPCPPTSQPNPLRLPCRPARLRAVPPGSNRPSPACLGGGLGGEAGGGTQWSHCPEAAPLKHKHFLMWWLCRPRLGRRPGAAGHALGDGDHPGLRGGPLPNGISASP